MYDWLGKSLAIETCHVVTANRRLARTLSSVYADEQIAAGNTAWKSPPIFAWRDWLTVLATTAQHLPDTPMCINAQQSRLLWEQCLREDLDDALINIGALAAQCWDTWVRLNEWNLSLAECQNAATGQDQRIFARAAGRYRDRLRNNGWCDVATLPRVLVGSAVAGEHLPEKIVLAGFDRLSPQASALIDAIVAAGAEKERITMTESPPATLLSFEHSDAELRAAGAWARDALETDPGLTVAIVVSKLEQNAARVLHLLQEGLVPGWQYAGAAHAGAVDISYGRRLSSYPAVHAALLALHWLHNDLTGNEVSLLLRTPFIGVVPAFTRTRLEVQLREWPDRRWSRGRLLAAMRDSDDASDATDWLQRFAGLDDLLDDSQNGGSDGLSPSAWAKFFDTALRSLNWPGDEPLNSVDYQLENRWRELLNEFARLELICPSLSGKAAVTRLTTMAGDVIFQAESDAMLVSVLGPLEAAGLQFDRVWVTGVTESEWPPAGRPLALLSRQLQRQHGMPDADPDDTVRYAARVLQRLRGSASDCVFSYPQSHDDAEQLPSALVGDLSTKAGTFDPGWHAVKLIDALDVVEIDDRVPPVLPGESISGGAGTIVRQFSEPFAAFVHGRLDVRLLPTFTIGIAPSIRGRLIHDALFHLYAHKPAHRDICAWSDKQLQRRIDRAIDRALQPHERHADTLLRQLLQCERRRTAMLLRAVVNVDRERAGISIEALELALETQLGDLRLSMRVDRTDRVDDGGIVILDYKTGSARKFLSNNEPADMQLVVYACAMDGPVAALGLFNVDAKAVGIDGAGPALAELPDWQDRLDGWKHEVFTAVAEIAAGDVSLNVRQASRDARPLSPLSRIAELKRGY